MTNLPDLFSSDAGSPRLVDSFQRKISYLRLSVTDRCDLRCTYCMPERMQFLPRKEILSLEELYDLCVGFIERGVTKIRLTGGEPLVRRDVIDLIRSLGKKLDEGLEELTLTTNGTQLGKYAEDLFRSGVRRVNVSLDTRNPEKFERLSRRNALDKVLDGLSAAKQVGLRIKINTVALKGVNEHELTDLIAWSHGQGFDHTLIEVMPLGEIDEDRVDHFLPLSSVRRQLEKHWTLIPIEETTGGPAKYDRIEETGGRLGMITPLTNNFCANCNRLRVTATGQLYPCLGGAEKVDLRAALRSAQASKDLEAALRQAMLIKPKRHHFQISERGSAPAQARHMSVTGG